MYNKNGYIYTDSGVCIAKLKENISHTDFEKHPFKVKYDTSNEKYYVDSIGEAKESENIYEYFCGLKHTHKEWYGYPTEDVWTKTSEEKFEEEYNDYNLKYLLVYPNCLGRTLPPNNIDTGYSIPAWMVIQTNLLYNMFSYDGDSVKVTYTVSADGELKKEVK